MSKIVYVKAGSSREGRYQVMVEWKDTAGGSCMGEYPWRWYAVLKAWWYAKTDLMVNVAWVVAR